MMVRGGMSPRLNKVGVRKYGLPSRSNVPRDFIGKNMLRESIV